MWFRNNRPLDGLSEKDATVIRFGRQMLNDKKLDSATCEGSGIVGEARRDGYGGGDEHVRC